MGPDEFRAEYLDPPDHLEEHLPDRPITSLRDIQHLYGTLYELATIGDDLHGAYLTPSQAEGFMGEPESLIAVSVDLSGESPQLGDPPVLVTKYTEDLVSKVAHSRYVESAAGIDHSITHQSGRDSNPEKLAGYAVDRLGSWPTKDPIQRVAEDQEAGWIIEALGDLGASEEAQERIREAVEERLGGPRTALVTVKVQLPGEDEYRWPGEIDVFQEAMRERKATKMASKGAADDASGKANDLLTGEETRTVGTTGDPFKYYLSKQQEKFPGLDANRAWQAHPLSEDSAVTVANAEPLLEHLSYPSFGATVYYLPYIHGVLEPETTYELYRILRGMAGPLADEHATPIEAAYRQVGDEISRDDLDLRFYVAAVDKKQMSRWDVLGETLNGSILHPVDLARSHLSILDSPLFSSNDPLAPGRSPPFRAAEGWTLLDVTHENAALGLVATGRYFYETLPDVGDDGDPSADDPRIQALVDVLGGQPLVVEDLVANYAERIRTDEGENFPRHTVDSQFAQLSALASAGLLTAETRHGEALTEPFRSPGDPTMPDPSQDQETTSAEARTAKLEAFLEGSPALDDPERRSSFLLGALAGHVGSYQQRNGVSLTVVDQHPVGGLTKNNIKRRTQEILEKNIVYSREEGYSSTMYAEVVDRLRESILDTDPSTWGLPLEDLRFYYALGVSYGMNDYSPDASSSETTAPEATT